MRIGELSARTGIPARMLRYYEEQDLLRPERADNGYRAYEESAVGRVQRIRGLFDSGLTTGIIREILPFLNEPDQIHVRPECLTPRTSGLLRAEAGRIQQRIDCLARNRDALQGYLGAVRAPGAPTPRGEREQGTVEAAGLRLRPFTRADIEWVYQVSLDQGLRRFVRLPSPYRRRDAAFFVDQVALGGWESGLRAEFVAEDPATGRPLGRVGLGLRTDASGEIGFWVDPAARGRGVATTAVGAVCGWAFRTLGLSLVEWRAEVGNEASRRVAEKAGFRMEGTLRRRLVHRGEQVDAWVGSLLPDEMP
jgi:RimJ/RimL family protein N-acetyltransferase/DNA-binding transcriptional MerR regulator